jgi:hypothetical protein
MRQAREPETMRFSSPPDLTDTRACRLIIPIPAAVSDPDHARPLALATALACWSGWGCSPTPVTGEADDTPWPAPAR